MSEWSDRCGICVLRTNTDRKLLASLSDLVHMISICSLVFAVSEREMKNRLRHATGEGETALSWDF